MANNLRPGSYGPTAKFFHWTIFLLLAAQYAVGSIMPHIGRKTLDEGWVNWHLSLGAAILAVIVARFVWRLFHHVSLPADMPGWEIALSRFTHLTLYALVFVDDGAGLGGGQFPRLDGEDRRPDPAARHRAQGLGLGP